MTWGKIDDRLHSHPKALAAGLEAMGFWTVCMSHCAAYLTDGYVTADLARRLGFDGTRPFDAENGLRLAERLVTAGLWTTAEGGYQFHDWAQYHPTRASVLAEREAAARRMRERRARLQNAKRSPEHAPNVRPLFACPDPDPDPINPDPPYPPGGEGGLERSDRSPEHVDRDADGEGHRASQVRIRTPRRSPEPPVISDEPVRPNAPAESGPALVAAASPAPDTPPEADPPPPVERASRLNSGGMQDGCFGMTGEAFREGIASATGAPCAALSPADVRALQRAVDAHCPKTTTGEARIAWVRDTAKAFVGKNDARYGLSTLRFLDWLNCGKPDRKAPLARGKAPVQAPLNGKRAWKLPEGAY